MSYREREEKFKMWEGDLERKEKEIGERLI